MTIPFGEAALNMEMREMRERKAAEETENKGCPCNSASTENCAQCRDTDSSGAIKNS